jgi:hypothetical protein
MRFRRFSKSVAAAILAVSMLSVGVAAPADASSTSKTPTHHSQLDTGWG